MIGSKLPARWPNSFCYFLDVTKSDLKKRFARQLITAPIQNKVCFDRGLKCGCRCLNNILVQNHDKKWPPSG